LEARSSPWRDRLIYTGEPFDVSAMRAMREKQLRQLVRAGTINAKLSPGHLADFRIPRSGAANHLRPSRPVASRAVNTLDALAALQSHDLITPEDAADCARPTFFQRDLIDALRIVRGNGARSDGPPAESEEFLFLARRFGYGGDVDRLKDDLERFSQTVRQLGRLMDR